MFVLHTYPTTMQNNQIAIFEFFYFIYSRDKISFLYQALISCLYYMAMVVICFFTTKLEVTILPLEQEINEALFHMTPEQELILIKLTEF